LTTETIRTSALPQDAPPAPPAYFLSLTVENFRCFGLAQTLDLSRGENRPAPWTIILGENGVGKTTLLQCLATFQPEFISFPNIIDKSGQGKVFGAFVASMANIRALGFSPENTSRLKKGYRIHCGMRIGNNLKTYEPEPLLLRLGVAGDDLGIATSSATTGDVGGLICYGYGASRRMGKASLSEQRTDDTTASLFSDDVDLINAEEWLLQADYAASRALFDPSLMPGDNPLSRAPKSNTRAAKRRDQIKDILKALLQDIDINDVRFSDPERELSAPFVEFHTPYGWVRLKDLSLGIRTLITWMVDLASRLFDRYPKSANPLAEPAVVLVDEIDLHLHPRWQRTLLGFLSERFPNTQFIATAHSPLVVQAAEDANIVLLRREGDHVVIENHMEPIKNLRVDQILTSELFGLESARPPQVSPALEERKKILSKARLTKADRERLAALEAQIGDLPTGETPEDLQAMDIIRRAAELLKAQ